MQPDAERLAETVVATVKAALSAALGPVSVRLAAVEARASVVPRDGRDGKDADEARIKALTDELAELRAELAAVRAVAASVDEVQKSFHVEPMPVDYDRIEKMVATQVAAVVLPVPRDGVDGRDGAPGQDGTSVTVADVAPLVVSEVAKAVLALPPAQDGPAGRDGQDGTSVSLDEVAELVAKAVGAIPKPKDGVDGRDGQDGVSGQDGRSLTVDELAPVVEVAVAKAVGLLPIPRDGKDGRDGAAGQDGQDGTSVTLEALAPMVEGVVTKAVAALPVPRDGVGLAGALLDRDGHLVLTLSDGTLKDLGEVVGKSVDPVEVVKTLEALVAQIPRPKDGVDGKPGRDGLGIQDTALVSNERGIFLRWANGDVVKEERLPVPYHVGVWKSGAPYGVGTIVTWDGSSWLALAENPTTRPGTSPEWRLIVKRGGDGKPGGPGAPGAKGLDGRNGKDLTHLGPDGSKW